ncbi:hypothetical protein J6590_030319 [Homalodisca vitripennis]|nr:hypothetical protein J6590_030319 [Homalodisca vitripennis]
MARVRRAIPPQASNLLILELDDAMTQCLTIPGWSSASLAQQCSAASQQHSAPPLDRAHGTSRQCPSFLASKITRLDPMRLFLVGICEGKSVCSPSNS